MKSRWVTHKGKRVFYVDFSNFGMDKEGIKAEAQAVMTTVMLEPLGSVLALSDVRGTVGSPDNLATMQNLVAHTGPHVRRRATVGIGGIRKGFLDLINRFTGRQPMIAFDDVEQAKDWLVAGD
jgi:hypothetical protein